MRLRLFGRVIPQRPRTMLQHAHDSRKSSVACVLAAGRAVEAMLAEKGYDSRKAGLVTGEEAQRVLAGEDPEASEPRRVVLVLVSTITSRWTPV